MKLTPRARVALAVVAAPLPLTLLFVTFYPAPEGLLPGVFAFGSLILIYGFVLIPLAVAKGALFLASRGSLKAHTGAMFLATFLPMLSVYFFMDFTPDAGYSLEINDKSVVDIQFSIAGVLIAAVCGLLNAVNMVIYWAIAVRDPQSTANAD